MSLLASSFPLLSSASILVEDNQDMYDITLGNRAARTSVACQTSIQKHAMFCVSSMGLLISTADFIVQSNGLGTSFFPSIRL